MGLEFDTEKGDDLETLRERLGEAAAWFGISSRLPDSGFPRSPDHHPSHLTSNHQWIVRMVAGSRRTNVKADHETAGGRIEGRLLRYSPDESLFDGAAEQVTNGFFDWNNEPPWDLWLGYVVEKSERRWGYVVCWIPPTFVQAAADGIEVNPEGCIDWLPELEHELGLGSNSSS
jgi:hypothetical protein